MKKTYRICIFSAQYLPHMGGVEHHTYNLARKLEEKGHNVMIVASNVNKTLSYENNERIKVFRMPCHNFMGGRFPVPKLDKSFWKINRILFNKEFDLVIVNTRFYLHSLYGTYYAKKKNIRCIMIEHGTGHMLTGNRLADKIGEIYEHMLTGVEKLLFPEFYGVSYEAVKWLTHFRIKAKGVLYNSIDLERIEELYQNPVKDFRKEYGIAKDDIIITYAGRLVEEKGILPLMEAVKKLHNRFQNVYLFIAGEGELLQEVERRKADFLLPLGRLEFEQVVALLKQSDIFCLPTAYPEGFPTSTLEAMACRCYPVVTERGGARELILNSSYGRILSDNNTETIVKVLGSVLSNAEELKEKSMIGYQRVKQFFTWNCVVAQIEKICEGSIDM